jgi:hypothetical protein
VAAKEKPAQRLCFAPSGQCSAVSTRKRKED